MERWSKIDFIMIPRLMEQKVRVISMKTSDHSVLMADIFQEDQTRRSILEPVRISNKEMFFSSLLNDPKEEHL